MSLFFQVLLFGVLASAANVLGGLILFPSKLHSKYRDALRYVLALGAGFMLSVTPLEKVVAIRIETSADQADQIMRQSPHNYFPVIQGENVLLGYISARDYFRDSVKNLREQTRSACTLKKNQKASDLLKKFKERNQNFGVVVNDRGELFGLVTMHDIGESLLGKLP